ncbi:MAG TPA: 3-dehydroquinate synthase [Anaerolineales bacterium]|nr:3-dehydroquinate synthase [Anaerolineales bacterium]
MHIFLYGPPGTGKSTIGKILARNLDLPFVDLDSEIEANAGLSISQIMEHQGESVFRDLESAVLKAAVDPISGPTSRVIALGGGALLREENRFLAESHGTVVLLTADLSTLLERLKNESSKRPLLAGDLREKLTSLLEKRREHYSSFMIQLPVDEKTSEQSALEIQNRLGRYHLRAMGEYDVLIGDMGQIARVSTGLQNPLIVTDENVAKLHLEKIKSVLCASGCGPKSVVIRSGEGHKNLETVSYLWSSFLENGLDRKSTVIALGGGVIGDLVGFAASTYMRGIKWICVPTTLLSMVDASLGGKTGFDLPQGKNLIGSFYPPKLVLAAPQLLNTLPKREFLSGMAEVVKHGVISDPELFDLCTRGLDDVKHNPEDIVRQAMAVKIKIIEEDPYEKGLRAALNLGHTVGHAVELVSRFELLHGEAVAIGMVTEARFAERIGIAEKGLSQIISNALSALGLPVDIPINLQRQEIIHAMRVDKKKDAAHIRFALPAAIGQVELIEISDLESVIM